MGIIISLAARKGGVGKTTLAAHLAGAMADSGDVRVIDADPQKSLCVWASMGQGFLSSRVTAVEPSDENEFREAVNRLGQECDVLIIDTPPGFTEPAIFAARVSNLVLIPCGASPLDLAAARDAISVFRQIREQGRSGFPLLGLVPSRFTLTSGLGRDLASALAQLGERTLPGISQRVALAEAAISGLTIGEYAPGSVANREFKELAGAVRRFTNEKRGQGAKT